jgi:NADH-quinone oxidoreductase subunit N
MNYNTVLIEILTALLGVILLVFELTLPKNKKNAAGFFSAVALLIILGVSFCRDINSVKTFFAGFYTQDAFSVFFKQIFLAGAILVTVMTIGYKKLQDTRGEFFALIVFTLLGMMAMASATDFITLYIGLELMTITFVILTAIDVTSIKSSEAGLKYIVLSAMSSAVLLYGMSLIYGLSGSLTFDGVIKYFQNGVTSPIVYVAVVLVIIGFAFKISAVPFHMWSPDVYEGAPTPVTAFLAIGSKAAGFAVLIRILLEVVPKTHAVIGTIVIALASLTMLIGNLTAIPQKNIKRMLAYSSIAHAGYILLGIVAFTKMGVGAMMYYLLLYIFANTGAFAAVIAFSNETGSSEIESLAGGWKRSPFTSGVLLISLLSLAGIPPAAGFIGKFYLFAEIIRQGYIWLAFLALGTSIIAIYYYIMVVRVMFVAEIKDTKTVVVPMSLKIVMGVSALATLIMGIYPGPITEWTTFIASHFLK